jgi:outer membrane protein TolC
VEVAEQQVERVQRQYDVEQVAKSDLLKQKVFLGDMRVQYLNQQAAVKNSFNQLATLMGMDIDTDFSVIDEPEEATSIEDYSDFWEGVKANHPSLITKRTQIAGAILSLKISRASYLPTLSASFGFDGSSDVFEELYSDVDKNWRQQLRLTISYPLFTGLTRSSQVEKAKVAHKIQQEEYDALLKNLRVQFDSVVEQLENVQETIPIYRESKVSAEEDLRLAQERYNLGAATILEVLDAQLSVARANGSLVRTTYDRRILRAQLDAMMSKM